MEILSIFSPLIAFLVTGLFGRQIGGKAAQFITCGAVIIAAVASIALFFEVIFTNDMSDGSYTTLLGTWINSGDFSVKWSLKIDQLSVVMICVVNIISACVHLYSIGYMSKDPNKTRFMSYLSLFTFAMLILVSANNLLQLFLGWEGVGLASYLLIGFWNHKHSANAAAQKAFVVNRIGDMGLIIAMVSIFYLFGSLDFSIIFDKAEELSNTTIYVLGTELHAITFICMLLFIGAIGKSAQLGLHTWLPDAMEGPTPVSALIHAATMVTAGVFLIARFSPLFEYAPLALIVVTVVGATTAFVAASIAMTQFDIKRIIAYSTMSQLGYMFFALGVSAYSAAIFHLMTHAFFKALLFLGAGCVIHSMSHEQDIRNMGGLFKKIPKTYGLMLVGSLALIGIFPFAGYFSKDIILESAWADYSWFGHYAFWMGIITAFMTAFYSVRMLILVFHGPSNKINPKIDSVHESPRIMTLPLTILAVGAIMTGSIFYGAFVGSPEVKDPEHIEQQQLAENKKDLPAEQLSEYKEALQEGAKSYKGEDEYINLWSRPYFWHSSINVKPENDTIEAAHHVPTWVKILPLIAAIAGMALAYLCYQLSSAIVPIVVKFIKPIYNLSYNKWYFDKIYSLIIVKPLLYIGRKMSLADRKVIDAIGPDGFAGFSARFSKSLSKLQSGYIYHYTFVMIISLIAIISWFVYRTDPSFFMPDNMQDQSQMIMPTIEQEAAK